MQDFKELKVWSKAHRLTLAIYKVTTIFPKEEMYGMISQMRRCSVSVPANIAEGCGRGGSGELAHFLQIALGSASELAYHLLLARDLHFLNAADYAQLEQDVSEIKRMLTSLIQKVKGGN